MVVLESRQNNLRDRLATAWRALFDRKNIIHINLDNKDILDMIELLKEIK